MFITVVRDAMFDAMHQDYPKSWREMSFEFKLMFLYHGIMLVLVIVGGRVLSVAVEIAIATTYLVVGTVLAINHRRTTPWVWLGVSALQVGAAVMTIILGGVFAAAAIPLLSPADPSNLPWYLAILGIVIFSTLNALKLVPLAPTRQALKGR
jgi:hypothetical protein